MNRVHQPRPLVVLLLNVWMGTAAGADFFIVSLELSDPPVQTMKQKILYQTMTLPQARNPNFHNLNPKPETLNPGP